MTDDDKLHALFRDAASDVPPPAFGPDDVVAASRRITARRRSALVVGAVVLVAVASVGSVVAVQRGGQDTVASSAAPANAPAPEYGSPMLGGPDLARAPLGPGTTECADQQDPQLRALLDAALPEVAGAAEAATDSICLPGGQRGVSVVVADGASTGVLAVTYLPPGAIVSLPTGTYRSGPTASGGTVIVGSSPDAMDAPAPFADRLPGVLTFLAPLL